MRHLTILGVVVAMVMVMSAGAVAADKVGFINLQRLVNESEMGKEAQADIKKLREQREKVASVKLKLINRLRDEINAATNLSPEDRRAKIENIQKHYKEFQRMVADSKEDIAREDRELVSIILKKADDVLKKVAKKKKYTIILMDPNAVGYLDPDVDITDDVLKELNKK